MAKNNRDKTDLSGIDAESIIHSFRTPNHLQMVKEVKESKDTSVLEESELTDIPESPKEENRRRRGKTQDYESLFIKETRGVTVRESKTVYIRKVYHDRILKIVRVIGGGELSLFNFLDNVLEHHFSMYQDEITTLYDKKNEGIF
ncbi:MAG: DUF3408 domain-containing protein [Dysgonamonadaceae bacterium]|jgi:hypothetical protein|nr:DUF3408 domain-containing protein [Dysgonamonadaceae bacterium]